MYKTKKMNKILKNPYFGHKVKKLASNLKMITKMGRISKNFELNFEKFCKVFRKFAWRNVHSAGCCKVPFL